MIQDWSTVSRQQNPGVSPASRLVRHPNGLGILNAYPAPNLTTPINGTQNWYMTALHPQNQRKDTIASISI